jgi:hypothetical protein
MRRQLEVDRVGVERGLAAWPAGALRLPASAR